MTDGTTLCPHCATRFRIGEAQLAAHGGMVRCGHCRQAFDARANYQPDQPSPQLDLPIEPAIAAGAGDASQGILQAEPPLSDDAQPAGDPIPDKAEISGHEQDVPAPAPIETANEITAEEAAPTEVQAVAFAQDGDTAPHAASDAQQETADASDSLDFSLLTAESGEHPAPAVATPPGHALPPEETSSAADPSQVFEPAKLAGEDDMLLTGYQPAFDADAESAAAQPQRRAWPWVLGICILLLALVAQAAYFFRIDLAAQAPALKPALQAYCEVLGCDVPLPRNAEQIGIESSSLDADAEHTNQVNLDVLLRNRASHTLAFPALSLTLNDIHDKPLANRTFLPADYLSPSEKVANGMAANRELSIQLHLDTGELHPVGYRLELFYPH